MVKTGEPVAPVLERRGQFADLILSALGAGWDGPVDVVDARAPHRERFPGPRGLAAIVITGSAASVPDREPWMLETEAWLRAVVDAGTPTMGLCFGHQLLAQALGGEVARNPRGREIGTVRVERTADDPLFDGLPASFEANATHVDTVTRLPAGATALARSPLEDHHAIRFTRTVYGVQFHPEIDAEVMRAYLHARREPCAAEGLDVDALLGAVSEAELGRRTLANFVRHIVPLGHAG